MNYGKLSGLDLVTIKLPRISGQFLRYNIVQIMSDFIDFVNVKTVSKQKLLIIFFCSIPLHFFCNQTDLLYGIEFEFWMLHIGFH